MSFLKVPEKYVLMSDRGEYGDCYPMRVIDRVRLVHPQHADSPWDGVYFRGDIRDAVTMYRTGPGGHWPSESYIPTPYELSPNGNYIYRAVQDYDYYGETFIAEWRGIETNRMIPLGAPR